MPTPSSPSKKLDIAVIGAGVSGAYAAWRLKAAYPRKRIALFEWSDRVGGRLYSVTLPGMPHVQAELGGMRFIRDKKLVAGLVNRLELQTKAFPMGAPPPIGARNNILYLRGQLLRVEDLADWTKVPYGVRLNERGKNPDELQSYVTRSLFPDFKRFTRDNWFNAAAFNGEPLYEMGFWNLLYRMLSSEAYQLMKDAGGYYTNVSDSSAASALSTTEFLPDVEYRTLVDGYDQLPKTLVNRFAGAEGGQFLPNRRLDFIGRRAPGQPYTLRFARTETKSRPEGEHAVRRTSDIDDKRRRVANVQADKVILAMPRRSIELISFDPSFDTKWLKGNLSAVIMQAAVKLFLAYEYPWWRSLGLEAGRSITDMPIRQTYYFGTEVEEGGTDPGNLNSLLMVSYNDQDAVPFWKALENSPSFEGRRNDFVAKGREVLLHDCAVTRGMVVHAKEQVAEVHGLKFVPEPYSAVYQDWTEDPFGAGWHGWKAGFKFWEIMKQMRKPLGEEDVHICGEAYSNVHGWVEGALQTAELMLEEHFGLDRPEWLERDYDLGP